MKKGYSCVYAKESSRKHTNQELSLICKFLIHWEFVSPVDKNISGEIWWKLIVR